MKHTTFEELSKEKMNIGQNDQSKPIIKKYEKLHEACSKYPTIVLGNKPKVYQEHIGYAKDGFVEKFCK